MVCLTSEVLRSLKETKQLTIWDMNLITYREFFLIFHKQLFLYLLTYYIKNY